MVGDGTRKYRQQGYRDSGGDKPDRSEPPRRPEPPPPPDPGAPRATRMLGSRTVSRCAECGTLLPTATEALGQCPKCRRELHSCRQCTHFDPGRRFECTQPIPERLPDKSARNDCPFFALRVMVERDASAGAPRPEDARRAFGNLFRR